MSQPKMEESTGGLFGKFAPHAARLPHIYGNSLHLFVNESGKILEMSDRWLFNFPSVAEEILRTGHLRRHFDLPENPPPVGEFVALGNKKALPLLGSVEQIYATFPTVVLYLLRIEKGLYYGSLRVAAILPNIGFQRPSGLIYVRSGESLAGFNETFYQFFRETHPLPAGLLNQPLSRFLSPTPGEMEEGRVSALPVPNTAFMTKLHEAKISEDGFSEGLALTPGLVWKFTDGAVVISNPGNDYSYLTVKTALPPGRDASLEFYFTPISGGLPLILLCEMNRPQDLEDRNEYALTTDADGRFQLLKRNGLVQRSAPLIPSAGARRWRFSRSHRALLFFEGDTRKIACYDPNYLHAGEVWVRIGLRPGSSCKVVSLRLFCAEKPSVSPPDLPVATLLTPARDAVVLNPVNNITLSLHHPEIAAYLLENVTEMRRQVEGLRRERERVLQEAGLSEGGLLGKSTAMTAVREAAARAARTEVTLLLQGETGTGKELLARFVHRESRRGGGPFVKVDCSTLPRTLMESELFGHEKGAFTGALAQKTGLLEEAQGGTLFLDEIENLTSETQVKLLQFFQDHAVTRVGGLKPVSINLRIIAASNAPLSDLVRRGQFRADLFYRMEVVSIALPPLRERSEDIPDLCRHFIAGLNFRHGRKIKDLTSQAYQKLLSYPWPGNVRELKNVLERAVIFCDEELVPPEHLKLGEPSASHGRRGRRPLRTLDAESLKTLFRAHGGVALQVARVLKVSPRALYDKIDKCGLTAAALRIPQ